MRIAVLVVCVGALGACNKKVENKRVEKLDFKGFSVAVPAGWNEVTDSRILKGTAPGSHTLILVDPPKGFAPSIYISDLVLDDAGHKMLQEATADSCRDAVQKPILEATRTTAGFVKVAEIGGFKGCDIEMIDRTTQQSAQQYSMSNGKLAFSVVCNRDKSGAPDVDAICTTIASTIKPTP